jgi:hypothetical protein
MEGNAVIRRVVGWTAYVSLVVIIMFLTSILGAGLVRSVMDGAITKGAVGQYNADAAQINAALEASMQSEIKVYMAFNLCEAPADWNHKEIPAGMLLQKLNTYTVSVVPWTYPAPSGYWTLGLCQVGPYKIK